MIRATSFETALPKPSLPKWIFDGVAAQPLETMSLEEAGFASGSSLAVLHMVLHDPISKVPMGLLRSRLALRAAVHCNKIEGRNSTEQEVRDAFFLTAPGDAMGQNGDMLAFWRTHSGGGAATSLNHGGWRERLQALLPEEMQEHVEVWFDAVDDKSGGPVEKAHFLLSQIISAFPRQEAAAMLCADVVLARILGWDRVLPMLSQNLKRTELRAGSEGTDIHIACHQAIARSAQDTTRLAHDLARRAARLLAVEPKLRSKGSSDAVRLFLSEDAVVISPMLTPTIRGSSKPMTPRSALRLCERLVELGVVRELTGRKTFRLYGVA